MMTLNDFSKKQIVFIMCNDGEKMAISNDNLVVKNPDGKIKFQITCYRLFLVCVVGNCSLTTVLLKKAKQFGFFIALMSSGFRMYAIVGAEKDGNTLLKRKQYAYHGLDIAKHITENKISNQIGNLKKVREKSDAVTEAMDTISVYLEKIKTVDDLHELMAYEGLSSKVYFKNHFNNILWTGRHPRIKNDIINSVLDIAYSLLFAFVDALLESFGFDIFCGVMHTQFYMRKSLVCDLVEPFRPLIDQQVKKSVNLKQITDNDFYISNHQYRLKYEKNANYVQFLMTPIIENKDEIFKYIQSYYRSFMKESKIEDYPVFNI